MSDSLIIVGASIRAAAFSARAAGMKPAGVDLFADADLEQIAIVAMTDDYPQGITAAARKLPAGPWMYTGAIENHPGLVDRLAIERPLLGNRADVLRRARDPFEIHQELSAVGFRSPALSRSEATIPRDGSWLCKPYLGSGGLHIQRWNHNATLPETRQDRFYFQKCTEGVPHAAVFIAASGQASLLGATRQIIGASWAGIAGFQYAGSIGPIELPSVITRRLQRLGDVLASQFSLTGVFGVDFLLAGDELIVIEINPRYPASAEIVERATGVSVVGTHVTACQRGTLPAQGMATGGRSGKVVLFSERDLVIPPAFTSWVEEHHRGTCPYLVADIPRVGTSVPKGSPITTLLADADDIGEVETKLRRRAAELQAILAAS